MKWLMARLLSVALITAMMVTGFTVTTANAGDEYGAWDVSGPQSPNWPLECLMSGTTLLSGSPYKHNIEASNACNSTFSVEASEALINGMGQPVDSCDTGWKTNVAECQVDDATPSTDYWIWENYIDISGVKTLVGCIGSSTDFNQCWQQGDPSGWNS